VQWKRLFCLTAWTLCKQCVGYTVLFQYYYNSQTQQYLYWDGEKQTYLPAPTSGTSSADTGTGQDGKKEDDQKKRSSSPDKKVKVAKKIVKVNEYCSSFTRDVV